MKLSVIRKVLKDDLAAAGGDIPAWMDPFLATLNNFIEQVGKALQGRLTFADNWFGKEISQSFTHGVAQTITPPTGSVIKGMQIVDPGGQTVTGFGFVRSSKPTNEVSVTINFSAGGSTAATCVLQIQYR